MLLNLPSSAGVLFTPLACSLVVCVNYCSKLLSLKAFNRGTLLLPQLANLFISFPSRRLPFPVKNDFQAVAVLSDGLGPVL